MKWRHILINYYPRTKLYQIRFLDEDFKLIDTEEMKSESWIKEKYLHGTSRINWEKIRMGHIYRYDCKNPKDSGFVI